MTQEQISVLRAWIDQGAPWEEGFVFQPRYEEAPLALTSVDLPADAPNGWEAPLDRFAAAYLMEQGIDPASLTLCDDRTFIRRATFDLIGLPPTPAEIEAFVADSDPNKRAALIDRLLADEHAYAQHWLTFWNDCLRNDYAGTGYIDGGRSQITNWLYASLVENKPLDEFVAELISPTPESEGFLKGIVWRGVVNASQRPPIQAAQNLSQVFLGINLKCASCHDSFVNDWKLNEAYALAAVFADEPLEVHRCDQPTGEYVEPAFLYPELGDISGENRSERLRRLSEIFTSQGNGRFPRTMVNRYWQRLFGRGLVDPVDELDAPAWSRPLLDHLALEFVRSGYDVKQLLRTLATSRAYSIAAVETPSSSDQPYVFRGPWIKRLSAEQFCDAVSTLTHHWPTTAAVDESLLPANMKGRIRAVLGKSDALLRSLGRPNREHVVTIANRSPRRCRCSKSPTANCCTSG